MLQYLRLVIPPRDIHKTYYARNINLICCHSVYFKNISTFCDRVFFSGCKTRRESKTFTGWLWASILSLSVMVKDGFGNVSTLSETKIVSPDNYHSNLCKTLESCAISGSLIQTEKPCLTMNVLKFHKMKPNKKKIKNKKMNYDIQNSDYMC